MGIEPADNVVMSLGVEEHYWNWTRPGSSLESRIRYFTAGTSGPLLLLLHGFGVGAYHYERNIDELSKSCRVFAVDVLGQGSSWPSRLATQEDGLYISIDTWISQITEFATEVMGASSEQPTYIAGNSLGGLLAVYMGAMHADLVRGLVLLNATPFWSFRPPLKAKNQGIWGWFPEGFGLVPVPSGLKSFIERLWWNNLRSPRTVRSMLQLVYSNNSSVDEETVQRILEATEQPLALDVFSAIALAPKPELGFDECLDRLRERGTDVLMLYGREDPWVVPLWGRRLKKRVPSAIYLEMSPAGHCPHHEVPNTVTTLMLRWISTGEAPVPEGGEASIEEEGGRLIKVRNLGSKPSSAPSNWLTNILVRDEVQ